MEHYRETARRLADWPCAGVKIHNLHIVAGSELAQAWQAGLIHLLDEHEYAAALIEVLRRLPPTWPILRLSSDTPKDRLLAPRWWFGKAQFRQYVERQMREQGWRQGDLLTPKPKAAAKLPPGKTQPLRQPEAAPPIEPRTDLGRFFATAIRLPQPASGRSFAVLDLGFGLGNLLLDLLPILLERVTENPLRVVGLGWDRSVVDVLRRRNPEYDRQLAILGAGCALHDGRGAAVVQWGDPRRNLFRLRGRAELIVLEPRIIEPNVTLFTQDFLCRVARLLVPNGVLVATSDHPALRGALRRLGMTVGRTETNALPDGGTVASWQPEAVLHPLPASQFRSNTAALAGVPYRDRSLTWTQQRIVEHRANVISRLSRTLESP
jgi:SAM-dependent methyltransferase